MIKNEVTISEHHELLALHKALIEAKFHPNPENLYVSGSPFIADICNRVVEALIEIESQKNPLKREGWMEWLDIKRQEMFWNRAIKYAQEFNYWNKCTMDKKKEYVRCLLSPFRFDEKDVSKFINEVEAKK